MRPCAGDRTKAISLRAHPFPSIKDENSGARGWLLCFSSRCSDPPTSFVERVVMLLAALTLAPACSDDPHADLQAEWQRMMQCSAYFSLRASAARESRTAAAGRTADAAQRDA